MKFRLLPVAFLFTTASFLLSASISLAYRDDYPPYKFGEKPPAHLVAVELLKGKGHYNSADGRVTASCKKDEKGNLTFSFMVDGKLLWGRECSSVAPSEFYKTDLNKDGLEDYIVITWGGGAGLGSHISNVDIFLARKGGTFDAISYEGFDPGLEDFVDLNSDGKYEAIIETFYGGKSHNYFVYNVYKFAQGRLVNGCRRISNILTKG